MLTREDDININALHQKGWTVSAIARHTGRDRKTVRGYLSGARTPGVRAKPAVDPFDRFVDYVTARLVEDPHLWALTLFDELQRLGFTCSYPTLTRQIRSRSLRPVCGVCGGDRAGQRDHRSSARGGNPVGLAGATRPAR